MFGGFEAAKDEQARKRWFASAGTSLVVYAVVGVGLLVLARQTVAKAKEEPPIDVTFRAAPDAPEIKADTPPPPPPPRSRRPPTPPRSEARARRAPAAAADGAPGLGCAVRRAGGCQPYRAALPGQARPLPDQ